MLQTLKDWDRELFVWLNGLGIEQADAFWIYVTQISSWTPLFLLFIFLIFYKYKWKRGPIVFIILLVAFALTLFLTDLTKDYVARLRPNNAGELAELIRILQKPTNFSFFSGHASTSFAVTTFVVLALRDYSKWIYLAYIWPLIFVMSRIYVGVHYPSDIAVGAGVGTIIAVLLYKLMVWLLNRLFPDLANPADGETIPNG